MELTSFSNIQIKRILRYYWGKNIDSCFSNGELQSGFYGARGVGCSDACKVMLLQCMVVSLGAFALSC
ncbi:hypothetical protein BT93_C2527 [Corymbia citriodora subsp. variegata]|nr:hypothetical protein BT93_C2527 [Corymbia citriodora subsp. variegata]